MTGWRDAENHYLQSDQGFGMLAGKGGEDIYLVPAGDGMPGLISHFTALINDWFKNAQLPGYGFW